MRNRNLLTFGSFAAMFFLGVGTAIIGAASRNIGLSPFQIGLLLSIQNVGFIISVIVVGTLADSVDKTRLLFLSSLILALSFFFFYQLDDFLLNLVIMVVIGVGIGGYEGASDPLLLDIHRHRESLFISVNHFFVTFGELMITIYLIFLQMDWRRSMVQSSLAVLGLAVLFGLSRLPARERVSQSFRSRMAFAGKQRPVIVLFLMASCAVGIELALIGMITSLLIDLHGFDQVTSKIGLLAFLLGIAVGRLVLGFLAQKDQLLSYILVLFLLTAGFLAVLLLTSPAMLMTYLLLFLTGATLSVIFPLIISLAGLKYPGVSGTVMGVIKLGIPVGGIVVPLLLSVFTREFSFQVSLLFLPLIGLIGFVLALTNKNQLSIVA